MLRLILLLVLYTNAVIGMTLNEYSGDCPPNYREIMPPEFIDCAKLSADQKFDEGLEILKKVHGSNKYFNANKICDALKCVYKSATEKFNSHDISFGDKKYSLDINITEKDFIYENLLRYFWWNHYYPLYEGLSSEIILDLETQYFKS